LQEPRAEIPEANDVVSLSEGERSYLQEPRAEILEALRMCGELRYPKQCAVMARLRRVHADQVAPRYPTAERIAKHPVGRGE